MGYSQFHSRSQMAQDGVQQLGPSLRHEGAEVERCQQAPVLLFLSSGQQGDLLAACIRELGWDCTEISIEARSTTNLLCIDAWEKLMRDIREDKFQAVFSIPPCSTFEDTASGSTEHGADEKFLAKIENLLTLRVSEALTEMARLGKVWGMAQPARLSGQPSAYYWPEFVELSKRQDACFTRVTQCHFGSDSEKATEILGNFRISGWPQSCNHPLQWWFDPASGQWAHSAHPPSARPSEQERGPLSKQEAYPRRLCEELAKAIVGARVASGQSERLAKAPGSMRAEISRERLSQVS